MSKDLEGVSAKLSGIIANRLLTKEDKIPLLMSIEDSYKELLLDIVYNPSLENLQRLRSIFNNLSVLIEELGDIDTDNAIKHYTDSAIFRQYVIALIGSDKHHSLMDAQHRAINNLKHKILVNIAGHDLEQLSSDVLKAKVKEHKEQLIQIRQFAKVAIEVAESKTDELYVADITGIFDIVAERMRSFLGNLYQKSERELESIGITPPCKYSVIGLGSMALKQITPFSDFELAILTEYDKFDDYFRKLTHLVHFKVICLGETIIPTSRYGMDLSHIVHPGVNFDLGGKTPLGRIENDKPYSLIQTIEGMLKYLKNEGNKASHIDKNLPFILERTCHIHGDEELATEYQKFVNEFLKEHGKDRAITRLRDGIVEIDYFQSHPPKHACGNLEEFTPDFVDSAGHLFNVKQDIYRLLERLMYNLGLYYGALEGGAIEIIEELCVRSIISQCGADNLKFAMAFANALRLTTYLHSGYQCDSISPFSSKYATNPLEHVLYLAPGEYSTESRLFKYFYTALELHSKLEHAVLSTFPASFLDASFHRIDEATTGLINYRLMHYKEAKTALESAEKQQQLSSDATKALACVYTALGEYDKALEKYKTLYDESRKLDDQVKLMHALHDLGNAYSLCQMPGQAIEYYTSAIIFVPNGDTTNLDSIRNHLAAAFYDKGDVEAASAILLSITNQSSGASHNLGLVCQRLGYYDAAIKHYTDSLKLREKEYSMQPNLYSMRTLVNLGNAYLAKCAYEDSIECLTKSLNMHKILYNGEPNHILVGIEKMLCTTYTQSGQLEEALHIAALLGLHAIILGDIETVSKYITVYNVNSRSADGASLLYHALGYDGQAVDIKIVQYLLDIGADPNQQMNDGDTPMHMACYKAHVEAINYLIAHGAKADIQNQAGKSPLAFLIEQHGNDTDLVTKVKELLDKSMSPTMQDNEGHYSTCSASASHEPTHPELPSSLADVETSMAGESV